VGRPPRRGGISRLDLPRAPERGAGAAIGRTLGLADDVRGALRMREGGARGEQDADAGEDRDGQEGLQRDSYYCDERRLEGRGASLTPEPQT
jgi:hypothetical protein